MSLRAWCNCLRIRSVLASYRVHWLAELRGGRSWSMLLLAMARVVQRKSPPLVGFTSLPVASLLSTASTAASLPISIGALDPSSPGVEVEVAVVKERSWLCHACTYEQDFVPGSRTCVMCNTTRRRLHGAPQIFFGESKPPIVWPGVEANRTVPTVISAIGVMPACLLAMRNASMIYGQMQTLKVH